MLNRVQGKIISSLFCSSWEGSLPLLDLTRLWQFDPYDLVAVEET